MKFMCEPVLLFQLDGLVASYSWTGLSVLPQQDQTVTVINGVYKILVWNKPCTDYNESL
jgi:hypothetical protein